MAVPYGYFPGPGAPRDLWGPPPPPRQPREPQRRATQDSDWTCIVCLTDQRPNPQMAFCSPTNRHGVCAPCLRQYAAVEFGQRHASLVCPEAGCSVEYSLDDAHLKQWIGRELVERFTKLAVAHEIEEAGLGEMMEYCPQCGEGGIIEDDEHEFFCPNPRCGAVICRRCRREAHGSVPCRAGGDEQSANRIRVEEAMSKALIRSCPRCRTACIKEEGCNKMTCASCQANFCYICREEIDGGGYDHFEQPPNYCLLYDEVPVDERHNAEVRAAEREARLRYLGEHAEAGAPRLGGQAEGFEERRRADDGRQYLYRPPPPVAYLDDPPRPGGHAAHTEAALGGQARGFDEHRADDARRYFYRPPPPVAYLDDPPRPAVAAQGREPDRLRDIALEGRMRLDVVYFDPPRAVPGPNEVEEGPEGDDAWDAQSQTALEDFLSRSPEQLESLLPGFIIPFPLPPPNFPGTLKQWLICHYHWLIGLPPLPLDWPVPELCEVGCSCNKNQYCYVTYRHFGWPLPGRV